MKKTLIAFAALAVAGAASAQVTMSGALNFEYGRTNAAGAKASNDQTESSASNLAWTAVEDLGGGMKATAYAQHRFNGNDGGSAATGARLFQNTTVALSGGFGTITAGRFLSTSQSGYDAFGGWGAGYGYVGKIGARSDNSIGYASPSLGGAALKLVTTIDPGANAREYQLVQVSYSSGPLSVLAGTERNVVAIGAATTSTETGLGLSYNAGAVTLLVNYGKGTDGTSNTSVGVRAPMGAMTVKAQYTSGDAASVTGLGVDYALSKKAGFYADVFTKGSGAQSAYRMGLNMGF